MRNSIEIKILSWLVPFSLLLVTLLITPFSLIDPFNLPKMCALIVLASVFGSLILSNTKSHFTFTHRPILIAVGLFLLQLLVVLSLGENNLDEQFYGTAGRNTGVITYFSLALVLIASVLSASKNVIQNLIRASVITGLILIFYGNIQNFGYDPIDYVSSTTNMVFGTFGNSNFQSAFLGMFGSILFVLFFDSSTSKLHRVYYFSIICLSMVGIYQTDSIQGFVNFTVGVSIVLAITFYIWNKKVVAFSILTVMVLSVGLIFLAFFKIGPLTNLLYGGSVGARVYYWESALRITAAKPFLGVGLDGFADWFRRFSGEEVVTLGLTTNSAHSVLLDLTSGGGILLGIFYVAILIITMQSIIRVIQREKKFNREFLVLAGAWFAYQSQSFISINQIGLAIWGWALSGLIVGYELNTRDAYITAPEMPVAKGRSANQKSLTFTKGTFLAMFVGLSVGILLSLPAYKAGNTYFNALKTSNASIVKNTADLRPYNRTILFQAATILQRNNFDEDALDIANQLVLRFPDAQVGWKLILEITAPDSTEHKRALAELHRLDPFNPTYSNS
jgi:O-antigen ligase